MQQQKFQQSINSMLEVLRYIIHAEYKTMISIMRAKAPAISRLLSDLGDLCRETETPSECSLLQKRSQRTLDDKSHELI